MEGWRKPNLRFENIADARECVERMLKMFAQRLGGFFVTFLLKQRQDMQMLLAMFLVPLAVLH
jgi:hypothetical protein